MTTFLNLHKESVSHIRDGLLYDHIEYKHLAIQSQNSNLTALSHDNTVSAVLTLLPHTKPIDIALLLNEVSRGKDAKFEAKFPGCVDHCFQNHYMHESKLLELLRGLQLQFSKLLQLKPLCNYSFLLLLRRVQLWEIVSPLRLQESCTNTVTAMNRFRISNVVISRGVVFCLFWGAFVG